MTEVLLGFRLPKALDVLRAQADYPLWGVSALLGRPLSGAKMWCRRSLESNQRSSFDSDSPDTRWNT